jgi:hypothetical protein
MAVNFPSVAEAAMNDHLLSIPGRLAPVFYSVSFPTSLRTTKRDAGGPRRVSSAIAYIQVALAIVLCGCRHDHNSAQVVQIQDQQPSLEYDLAQATPHPPGSLERNYDQGPWRPPATPQLVFSTYLGGSQPCDGCTDAHTFALNAASDALGNTYVTGATSVSDLPVLHAWQPQPAASSALSAFVAKYDPSGRPLWCTYLGGDKQTMGIGVAAMPGGGVAVAGMTASSQQFPIKNGFQTQYHGHTDYFVTVFDAVGRLRYSTYLGGSGVDGTVDGDLIPPTPFPDNSTNGNNVAIDAHGLVYVTGTTASGSNEPIPFPVTGNALQPSLQGTTDAFLCIIDPAKSGQDSRRYCSFPGGRSDENGHSVAVSTQGTQIAVAGYTDSQDFPTTPNAYRPDAAPDITSNGFITQFLTGRPSAGPVWGSLRYRYSTYLGGTAQGARDDAYGLAMDTRGLLLVTGRTQSADFPMTAGGRSIYNSAPYLTSDQPYLVKLDPAASGTASLVYSTFLGGGGYGTSIAADASGNVWIAGEEDEQSSIEYRPTPYPVESPEAFPYTQNALFPSYLGGDFDAILMQVNAAGDRLAYSTHLGGNESDHAFGIAVDHAGNVIVTGPTSSQDFPLKNPAQDWPPHSSQNAFVTKFSSIPQHR